NGQWRAGEAQQAERFSPAAPLHEAELAILAEALEPRHQFMQREPVDILVTAPAHGGGRRGHRGVGLAIQGEKLVSERQLAAVGDTVDLVWHCRIGMTEGDRDPLAALDQRPRDAALDRADLAQSEFAGVAA